MEIWKPVPLEPYSEYYEVSNFGRVKSLAREIEVSGYIRKIRERVLVNRPGTQYLAVMLSFEGVTKTVMVHRLVCMAFLHNPENKKTVNHIDADKLNNKADNLEWATSKENSQHAARLGLFKSHSNPFKGEDSHFAKFSKREIVEIFTWNKLGFSQCRVAEVYGTRQSTVSKIVLGQTWKHVDKMQYLVNL